MFVTHTNCEIIKAIVVRNNSWQLWWLAATVNSYKLKSTLVTYICWTDNTMNTNKSQGHSYHLYTSSGDLKYRQTNHTVCTSCLGNPQSKQKANKPNKLKGFFAVVRGSHMIKTIHRKSSDRCPKKQWNSNPNNVLLFKLICLDGLVCLLKHGCFVHNKETHTVCWAWGVLSKPEVIFFPDGPCRITKLYPSSLTVLQFE